MRRPCPHIVQGYRASEHGVPKTRNPYPKELHGQQNPDHYRWELGWNIKFYGETLEID